MRNYWGNYGWSLVLILGLMLSNSIAEPFTDDTKTAAAALIEQLQAEAFAEREAALKELEQLPASSLPWLEEQVEATPRTSIELRSRLKSIVSTIRKHDEQADLVNGSSVELSLEGAAPGDVLKELNGMLEVSLAKVDSKEVWGEQEPQDFEFSGTYWEAVEQLLEAYPPNPMAEREDLQKNQLASRWIEEDFRAAGSPRTSAGILHLRHARAALENSAGKDHLIIHLMPTVEPRYQVEELDLLISGLELADGTVLEPVEKIVRGTKDRYRRRVKLYTWIFPLEKGVELAGEVKLAGTAKLNVRRLSWFEHDLPEDIGEVVKITPSVELSVLEREEGKIKIQFEGEGREPDCLDDYTLRNESYELFDEDGKELKFSVNSTSSGGGRGWRNSYGGKIDGEAKSLRVRLPGKEQEVQLAFEIPGVPLPGSSLTGAAEIPAGEGNENAAIEIKIDKDGGVQLDGVAVAADALEASVAARIAAIDGEAAVVVAADDAGNTQSFVDVVAILAALEVKKITMAGSDPVPDKPGAGEPGAGVDAEIEIAIPAVPEADAHDPGLVVGVATDGALVVGGKPIARDKLLTQLKTLVALNKDQLVTLRAAEDTQFERVVAALELCQEAGIWNVAFASTNEAGGE